MRSRGCGCFGFVHVIWAKLAKFDYAIQNNPSSISERRLPPRLLCLEIKNECPWFVSCRLISWVYYHLWMAPCRSIYIASCRSMSWQEIVKTAESTLLQAPHTANEQHLHLRLMLVYKPYDDFIGWICVRLDGLDRMECTFSWRWAWIF